MIRSTSIFPQALLASLLLISFSSPVEADSFQRIIVPIEVNGVSKGEILLLIGDDGLYVTSEDLGNVGIQGIKAESKVLPDGTFISLSDLLPAITSRLDESNYTLRLEVDPQYLEETTRTLSAGRPAGLIATRDTSAFFNYSLTSPRLRDLSVFGETGVSFRGNLLYSSFSRSTEGEFDRGLTNFTIDQTKRLQRIVVGDTFVVTDSLGGAGLIGGVSVSRNFELDPYFIRFPSADVTGALTSPSTVEIYLNGSLVRSERLPPGRFDLQDLPLTGGSGNTRVVIRDAFGQERVIDRSYYGSTSLLSPGLSEYSYSLGFVRGEGSATESSYNENPVFSGFHRRGISDSFTGGIRVEGGKELANAGLSAGFLLPIGQLDLSAAASLADGANGSAGSLSYSYLSRKRFSVGASIQAMSDQYATISQSPVDDRAELDGSAFVSATVGISTIALQYSMSANRDASDTNQVSATVVFPIGRTNIFLSASRSDVGDSNPVGELFAGLNYYFGRNTTANFSVSRSEGSTEASIDIQRSLPAGNGFGYRLSTPISQPDAVSTAVLQYQGPYGRYELSANPEDLDEDFTASAAGGIVAIGGSVYFSRPFSQSFALMRIPRVSGVEVLSSNLKVGRTNRRGEFLIPNLLPYYGNRLGIEQKDIPFEYQIQELEKVIAPPYRGGALVSFPMIKVQSVMGSIAVLIEGLPVVPAYGDLSVVAGGNKHESPIGASGEFYFENLPSGKFPAEVAYDGKTCTFEITIPDSFEAFLRLGELRCVREAK